MLPMGSDGKVRSQEKSWLLKTIMQLRLHANEPKGNPEPQATCIHTKPVNQRCGHHHWSMDEQHVYISTNIHTDIHICILLNMYGYTQNIPAGIDTHLHTYKLTNIYTKILANV